MFQVWKNPTLRQMIPESSTSVTLPIAPYQAYFPVLWLQSPLTLVTLHGETAAPDYRRLGSPPAETTRKEWERHSASRLIFTEMVDIAPRRRELRDLSFP